MQQVNSNEEVKHIIHKFSELMHKKIMLREDRWGKYTWRKTDPLDLLAHLQKEVAELVEEMAKIRRGETSDPEKLLMEAVDVANLAAMIADRYSAIPPEEEKK